MSAHHHHDHHGHVHLDEDHWAAMVAQTELEGEVLLGFVTRAAEAVAEYRPSAEVRRVLDVGSGPGVGTCELARCWPDASVTALDGSPATLQRAMERAHEHGVADRVTTLVAELPGGLDTMEPFDVIWASMSLHHVGDETEALRRLGAALAPGGVLAIAEFGGPTRFLPDDLGIGDPGLAARLEAAQSEWFAAMRDGLEGSVASAPLDDMARAAGFDVLRHDLMVEHFDAPLTDAQRRLVIGMARRGGDFFSARLSADDQATLAVLLDEHDPRGIAARTDLFLHVERQVLLVTKQR